MADLEKPKSTENLSSTPPSSSGVDGEIGSSSRSSNGNSSLGKRPSKIPYPNPREASIPDSATLREQWRFAIRQYSKWYSHAWGTAILAGGAFFALGWIIKGSNPLPSLQRPHQDGEPTRTESDPGSSSDRTT